MRIHEKLDSEAVTYEQLIHRPTFTSQKMAQAEHVHGMNVAKPVVVNADNRYYMCVLAACCNINFGALKSVLKAESVLLANEDELPKLFPDCDIGAEPPFGSLYGMPTVLDDRMQNDEFIVFQGGTHETAIKLSMKDYLKIEAPKIASFSTHT